jgi:heptosyltransferase II
MSKTLIIKADASGDVVRTTTLLNIIEGEIYWLTAKYNVPLFPTHVSRLTVYAIEEIPAQLFELNFELVLNLEESASMATLAGRFIRKKFTGVYCASGDLKYTDDSAPWYDMSLISRHGSEKADTLKRANTFSYQEMLFGMLGKSFNGERYHIYNSDCKAVPPKQLIGLETHVGKRWPDKYWYGYDQLNDLLKQDGFETRFFQRRTDIKDYLEDIKACSLLITGDTLAMHIALAYQVPCIALFNCTSPHEIYDYGILKKMISPVLEKYFYSTTYDPEAVKAISVEEVYTVVNSLIAQC